MVAYVIADVEVTDPAKYEEYRKHTPAAVAAYDGRFVVRGGRHERFEGDWQPRRLVVIEFPSLERAKAWYDSPAYRKAREIRVGGARLNMIAVEGV